MAAVVGLTLLELIRRQDSPQEVLEAENTAVTLPRRLGLSSVIDRRIDHYREQARRGRRMTDAELGDLVGLVVRRPDAGEVLFRAGRILAGDEKVRSEARGWRRALPDGLSFLLSRRAVRRRLRKLFGRGVGGFGAGPFLLEARRHVMLDADPGGDGCCLVTALCETLVQRYAGPRFRVAHDRCRARDHEVCRWSVLEEETAADAAALPELLRGPEPRTG